MQSLPPWPAIRSLPPRPRMRSARGVPFDPVSVLGADDRVLRPGAVQATALVPLARRWPGDMTRAARRTGERPGDADVRAAGDDDLAELRAGDERRAGRAGIQRRGRAACSTATATAAIPAAATTAGAGTRIAGTQRHLGLTEHVVADPGQVHEHEPLGQRSGVCSCWLSVTYEPPPSWVVCSAPGLAGEIVWPLIVAPLRRRASRGDGGAVDARV